MAAIAHRLRCEVLEARCLMAVDVAQALVLAIEAPAVEGVRAAEIQLQYDPVILNLSESDIQAGQAWSERASLVANVDEANGLVNIFLFSAESISSSENELVDLQFEVSQELLEDFSLVKLNKLSLNEQTVDPQAARMQVTQSAANLGDDISLRACMPWPKATDALNEPVSLSQSSPSQKVVKATLADPPTAIVHMDKSNRLATPPIKLGTKHDDASW